jgi:serine O-acetyltransferase
LGLDSSEDVAKADVPSGWSGIRSDFAHFCKIHGANGFRSRIRLLLASRAFWGLALYRFGRRVYALPRGPATLPLRALYGFLFEIMRRVTKTSLSVRSRIGGEVWMAPQGEVFVSLGSSVARGSMLHGGNTLGIGGRPPARGHPQVGECVVMCPGASAVGPVEIPAGSVIGPNSLVGRSLPRAGLWMGVPPKVRPELNISPAPAPRSFEARRRKEKEEQPMKPEHFWPAFRADLGRHLVYHPGAGALTRLRLALILDGSWAMALYRFGRRLRTVPPPAWLAPVLWFLYRSAELVLGLLTTISIDVDAQIEPGFYVGHFVSLQIGPGVKIGRNSSVGQMCTIEGTGAFPALNAPVLGERVYLGSGAKVIGPVRLADGAAVCANSVVVEDVPENGVVLGNPGVVISRRGSGDFIYLGAGTGVRDVNPENAQQDAQLRVG